MSTTDPVAPSEGDRLYADGAAARLIDGTERAVVFDFGTLLRIERKFGSLGGFTDELFTDDVVAAADAIVSGRPAAEPNAPKRPPRRLLEAIVGGFCAAWNESEEQVTAQLDPSAIFSYREVLTLAFAQALAPPDEAATLEGKASGSESGSPGTTSSSSAPSDTGAPTPSSGG